MPGCDEVPLQKLEIKVKEPTLVFPATPTKKHVYFLTNLDQNIAVSMRTVYIFNAQEDKKHDAPVSVIRDSLSKLLVHFYPMAGRLGVSEDGKLQVECEEQGAVFVDAVAENCIAELGELSSPAPFMRQLVYDFPDAKNILEVPPLIVQVRTNLQPLRSHCCIWCQWLWRC